MRNSHGTDSCAWHLARMLVVVIACQPLLLLSGCSPEDAQAAKTAAKTMSSQVKVGLKMYEDLLVRSLFEEPMSQAQLISGIANSAKNAAEEVARKGGVWKADEQRLRSQLADVDPAARARVNFQSQTKQIVDVVDDIESAAIDYETAWPLGSEQFVCLKQGLFRLAKNLRQVAGSFDSGNATNRFVLLRKESRAALDTYESSLNQRPPDSVAAATALQAFRDVMRSEAKANADVQAAFVHAAQSAADLYTAIESVENVTLVDILRVIQRYAPGLAYVGDSFDGAAIAKKAGVTLGKVQSNGDWLKRFANQPIPSATIKCKQT